MSKPSTRAKGNFYERIAARHLLAHGYRIVDRNFRCRLGEIDLIALDPADNLVFVEVRYRATQAFGGPLASVTTFKQRRIRRAAQFYLLSRREFQRHYCRFDVIGITGGDDDSSPKIEWIRAAFQ